MIKLHWAETFFYILILGLGTGIIYYLSKKVTINLPTSYKIKIVVLSKGCNVHEDIKIKALPHEEKIKIDGKEKTYNIKLEDLWKVKVRFYKRPLHFLLGIKGQYLCVFRSTEKGDPITNMETKATPVLIRKVKKSKILRMALNEVFRGGMGGFSKFIIVFGGTLLIVYLAYQYGLIG